MATTDKEYAEKVANAIIEQLKEGTAPWQKPWTGGQKFSPHNPVSGVTYKGGNSLYLMARQQKEGYDDSRWLTYQQAKDMGGQVKKGEKGTECRFWQWSKEETVKDEQGRPVRDKEGKEVKQRVPLERPIVRSFVVFNAEQVDGMPPLPDRPQAPSWEANERAEAILKNSGAKIEHHFKDRAFYRPSEDKICLPEKGQFANEGGYYGTALHELNHWTGHESRLGRDLVHPFGSPGYAREELRAEIASLMLSDELGIPHDPEQHVSYVGSWIKALEEDPREILRASADAQKITNFVLAFDPLRQKQEQQENITQPTPALTEAPKTAPKAKALPLGEQVAELGKQLGASEGSIGRGVLYAEALASDNYTDESEAAAKTLTQTDIGGEYASAIWQEVTRNKDPKPDAPGWFIPAEERQNPLTRAVTEKNPMSEALVSSLAENLVTEQVKTIAPEHTAIKVPWKEKDEAKALGAKWNKPQNTWYVPKGTALAPFAKWLNAKPEIRESSADKQAAAVDELADVLKKAGFRLEGLPKLDGALHRVKVDGDKGQERSGAYKAYGDGRPAGWYQNHKTGEKQNWKSQAAPKMTDAERREMLAQAEKARAEREKAEEQRMDGVAVLAKSLVAAAAPAKPDHPYLMKKQVPPISMVQATQETVALADKEMGQGKHMIAEGDLLIPMQNGKGEIRSLQVVKEDGWKGFLAGGQVNGTYAMLGDAKDAKAIFVAEGYATGASVHQATGQPVAVAFNASNLTNVAKEIRDQAPESDLYIAADDDRHLPQKNPPRPNVGKEKGEEAAKAVGGVMLLPTLGAEFDGIDWNDVAVKEGLPGLGRELQKGITEAQKKEDQQRKERQERPESLAVRTEKGQEDRQEILDAFRDLRGSAGIAADKVQATQNAEKAKDLVQSQKPQNQSQNQGQKLTRRAGR